jgi:lipoprotein-releasing system permease protein
MRFEYLIGLRYLRARRRERFVSLIAVISLVGVALGTFVLTVTLAMMSGFQEVLRQRLLAFTPHITIEKSDAGLWNPDPLARRIGALDGVVAVAPYVSSQVMAVSSSSTGAPAFVSGGELRGVVVDRPGMLAELQKTLVNGKLSVLDHLSPVTVTDHGVKRQVDLPSAIIGKTLAFDLGLAPGEIVTIVSPASLGRLGAPRLKRFVVGGLFYSGLYQFDSALIFVGLQQGRTLLADEPNLESGLEVRIGNIFAAPAIARRIADLAGPGFTVRNWTETEAPLFAALKLEKLTYFVVLLLMVLVAAFNIVATLVMVAMERRKEIAILQAMGARGRSIATIFLCEGAILGGGGTLLGVGAGFVVAFLIGRYDLIHLPSDVFMVSTLPMRLYPSNFLSVAIATVALSLIAAAYPALKASLLRPVEVIRYE